MIQKIRFILKYTTQAFGQPWMTETKYRHVMAESFEEAAKMIYHSEALMSIIKASEPVWVTK